MWTYTSPELNKEYRFPLMQSYIPKKIKGIINDCYMEELEAHLRGEVTASHLVVEARVATGCNTIAPPCKSERRIVSICSVDGVEVIRAATETLSRQFDLMKDYFSTFPDVDSITLPYDQNTIIQALSPLVRARLLGRLESCYHCVDYLRPIHSDYYLRLDASTCPDEMLERVCAGVDEGTRRMMARVHRIPDGAEGTLVAVPALIRELAWERLGKLLERYPTHYLRLLYGCGSGDALGMAREVLLKADFAQETEIYPIEIPLILDVMTIEGTEEEKAHLLAIMGIKCDLVGNRNSSACAVLSDLLVVDGEQYNLFPNPITLIDWYSSYILEDTSWTKDGLIISVACNPSSIFAIVLMMMVNVISPLFLPPHCNRDNLISLMRRCIAPCMDDVHLDRVRDHLLSGYFTESELAAVLVKCARRIRAPHIVFTTYVEGKMNKMLRRLEEKDEMSAK